MLVVANQTVDAPALRAALVGRAARGPIHATLLVPAAWSQREAAERRLASALAALERAGIPAAGELGDADPIVAVQEAWNPGRFDEVVVATLAEGSSRWLQIGLPQRVGKLTDCPVQHVEVRTAVADDAATLARDVGPQATSSRSRVCRAWLSRRASAACSAAGSPTTTHARSARVTAV